MTELTALTELRVPSDHADDGESLADYSGRFQQTEVRVLFRNLEPQLCELIRNADIVLGAVAWLTSEPILRALSEVKHGVSVVVQKEDFLRPEIGARDFWKRRLRTLYEALPEGPNRYAHSGTVGGMSYCGDPTIQPVRCVGNHNRSKVPAFPRMHNKFLVFCDWQSEREDRYARISPRTVWTGSFNLTRNATLSFENAVVLDGHDVAQAFYEEWAQIAALSEPLDWSSEWVEPEWRIGS